MKPLTREWLDKAFEDRQVAERELIAVPPAYSATCFHAQQAVEKGLKALLIELGKDFPRTHNLKYLNDLIKAETEVLSGFDNELAGLSIYAVEIRYPGWAPNKKQAEYAVKTMLTVFEVIQEILPDEDVR